MRGDDVLRRQRLAPGARRAAPAAGAPNSAEISAETLAAAERGWTDSGADFDGIVVGAPVLNFTDTMVWFAWTSQAFSRAPIPFLREPSDAAVRESLVLRHIGIYAYTRDALRRWVSLPPSALETSERLEQLRPLADGIAIGVGIVASGSTGIDTEEDLRRAAAAWPSPPSSATPPVAAGIR